MGTIAANPAESAAAEPNFDLASFTPEQYTAWEEKGTIPDAKPAESSPAKPEESQAGASPEDEPAAESAPAQSQEQAPRKKGAEARIQQLLRERNELQAKLAGYEKPSDAKPAAESSTAATKPAAEELKRPSRPVFGEPGHDSETWEQFEARQDQYTEALADWKTRTALKETREQEARTAKEREQAAAAKAIDEAFRGRMEKAREELPDLQALLEERALTTPISDTMDGFIRDREYGPKLLHYFLTHQDEAAKVFAMPKFEAAETIVELARSLRGVTAEPPKAQAPVKPITQAARPATDIRATSAAPVDPIKAAIEANDFSRYEEEANRRDIERRKRG